jgi:hypothetical protein
MDSATSPRTTPEDLDALWGRSEPDLELDDKGRIRSIPAKRLGSSRGSAVSAAAPIAIGLISSIARWD